MEQYWLWLSLLEGISLREKHEALKHFQNPQELYCADEAALKQLPLSQKLQSALLNKSLDEVNKVLDKCAGCETRILVPEDPRFPKSLLGIPDPPTVLYRKGRLPELNKLPVMAVVGTRKASSYGLRMAREMSQGLVRHGAVVVSGMAEGVDAAATQGALEGNGAVLGVLGCGIDVVYPKCNRELFQAMVEQGCLLSEYPPGTAPTPWRFPQRNRIISGLSKAVLVVEAPGKSGSMITARCAIEQGRDVCIVPGNVGDPGFEGSLELLKAGIGTIVTSPWDVLKPYESQYPGLIKKEMAPLPRKQARQASKPKETVPADDKKAVDKSPQTPYHVPGHTPEDLDPLEAKILAALSPTDTHIDTVAVRTGVSPADILSTLTMLEIKGYVTTQPGGWARTSENH